jgi:TatA/E family protein of Tat protein translocase
MGFGYSGEMIFIFFLALILFGPKKMPEIGRQVAKFLNEFRRASNEFRSQIEAEVNSLDLPKQQILPPGKAPLGSLASRIFNPPTPEKMEAAEAAATKTPVVETPAAETPAAETSPSAEAGLAPSPPPAPKVAADA